MSFLKYVKESWLYRGGFIFFLPCGGLVCAIGTYADKIASYQIPANLSLKRLHKNSFQEPLRFFMKMLC